MRKKKLTSEESKRGIEKYSSYVKKRNRKYLNNLKVTFEKIDY